MKEIVIINEQYLQTYSPTSKSAIFFETYTFKFRNLYGVFGACVEWRTSVIYDVIEDLMNINEAVKIPFFFFFFFFEISTVSNRSVPETVQDNLMRFSSFTSLQQECLSAGCHAISARGTAMEISWMIFIYVLCYPWYWLHDILLSFYIHVSYNF